MIIPYGHSLGYFGHNGLLSGLNRYDILPSLLIMMVLTILDQMLILLRWIFWILIIKDLHKFGYFEVFVFYSIYMHTKKGGDLSFFSLIQFLNLVRRNLQASGCLSSCPFTNCLLLRMNDTKIFLTLDVLCVCACITAKWNSVFFVFRFSHLILLLKK